MSEESTLSPTEPVMSFHLRRRTTIFTRSTLATPFESVLYHLSEGKVALKSRDRTFAPTTGSLSAFKT
jgi:hypothetical protein